MAKKEYTLERQDFLYQEEINKRTGEEIRVSICENEGRAWLDVRRWYYQEEGDGEMRPTSKGLAIHVEWAEQVINALLKGFSQLQQEGKVKEIRKTSKSAKPKVTKELVPTL